MNLRSPNWVQPGKIRYAAYEWLAMRVLFAYAMVESFALSGFAPFSPGAALGRGENFLALPYPRSLANFVDVTWINQPEHIHLVAGSLGVLLVVFVLGIAPAISMLGLLAFQCCLGSLENSQGGNVWHTSQVLALVMLGFAIAAVGENFTAWRQGGLRALWAERFRWLGYALRTPAAWLRPAVGPLETSVEARRSRTIYLVQQCLAVTYMVAGISKLWISKGRWCVQVQEIWLQFEKNQLLKYYQTLQPTPSFVTWATQAVEAHPTLTSGFFSVGLLLELGCFVALFNRGLMGLLGVALVVMHLLISACMMLDFYWNEWLVVIFFINVPYWLVRLGRTRSRGMQGVPA